MSMRPIRHTVLTIAVLLAGIGQATALESSFDVVNFNPALDNSDYLSVYGSQTLPSRQFSTGLSFDYANNPLECDGCPSADVVTDLLVGHFAFAIGATDWLQLGLGVPVVLYGQFNDDVTGVEQNDGTLGDLRFEPKFRLLNLENRRVGLSLLPFITIPTGNPEQFTGNGSVTGGAKLITELDIRKRVGLALNVGYRVHDDVTKTNTNIDDQITYGLGAAVHATPRLDVIAEASGYTVAKDAWKNVAQSPLEGDLGLRYTMDNGLAMTAGGGVGLVDGVGAPTFRVLAGLRFTPPSRAELVGDKSKESEAELRRRARETTYVDLKSRRLISDRIYFDFNQSTIQNRSYPTLEAIAETLRETPAIELLQVEGHTDTIGSDAYNQTLSEARALAAMRYLTQQGIEPARLTYRGFGETRPIAANDTEEGRAMNRRTEFIILVQKSEESKKSSKRSRGK